MKNYIFVRFDWIGNKGEKNMQAKQYLVPLMTFSLCVAGEIHAQEPTAEKKPNIIFILADDLGYRDISCNNEKAKFTTPNIDSIAKNGMNFTRFYSNQSVCAPARCSIMTGKHQGHCSVRANNEVQPEGQGPMLETTTLASLLKERGYATACIGKWGLGYPGSSADPTNVGFDLFFGANCQRVSHFYYPTHVWKNREKVFLEGNHPQKGGPHYLPKLCKEEALNFIRANKDQPFFIWYTTPIPHASMQVPEEYIKPHLGKYKEVPFRNSSHYTNTEHPRATYAGMVTHLDDEVGAMIEELKKLGLYENTILIFASDNGPSYEGGHDPNYFGGAAPQTTGIKTQLNEGGIRVPFMMSWPGKIKKGVCDEMYAFQDVMPTLLDAIGEEVPAEVGTDGLSMLPAVTGKGKVGTHPYLYWEFPAFGGQVAVVMGKWKALAQNIVKNKQVKFRLYDLTTDPQERHDVAAQHPEVMKEILKIVKKEHTRAENPDFQMKPYEDFVTSLK